MDKLSLWQELHKYRWLLEQLIARDLKKKYRKSILGYLWSVLNPLLMMIIMTIVFSKLFRFQIPNYPVYLLSGQRTLGNPIGQDCGRNSYMPCPDLLRNSARPGNLFPSAMCIPL